MYVWSIDDVYLTKEVDVEKRLINKIVINRTQEHVQAVEYWNRFLQKSFSS